MVGSASERDDEAVNSEPTGNGLRDERAPVLPRRRAARLKILDQLAGQFEPGQRYPERTVNTVLGHFHPDYCVLRRYLVEEGFMERDSQFYWRAGGTFDVD
jgi:hypothetical protein